MRLGGGPLGTIGGDRGQSGTGLSVSGHHYTRFFIRDENFDAQRDPKLTKAEAEHIDDYIDQYNVIIRNCASKHGFDVVDVCALLDGLAVRRNQGVVHYPLPPALADLSILTFQIHPSGRLRSGGLISLDGVHPTVCGYSLIAQLFIDQMKRYDPSILDMDFAATRRSDPPVSKPPRTLDDIFEALGTLERHFHVSRWLGKTSLSLH